MNPIGVSPILLSLLTFLVGFLLGHWLAIGRDRRKEFNEIAARIRATLVGHRTRPSPFDAGPTVAELDLFTQHLRGLKRRGFRKAVERYYGSKKAAEQRNSIGEVFYENDQEIKAAIDRVIGYTRLR